MQGLCDAVAAVMLLTSAASVAEIAGTAQISDRGTWIILESIDASARRRTCRRHIATFPCSTVDWDISQADDFRRRGEPWTIK
jgi:hypothetical protein